jgi:uncharacterized membrane protein YgaE (UPF0421/DUF939 family)
MTTSDLFKFTKNFKFANLQDSIRVVIAVLAAMFLAHFIKLSFPYWVTMTTLLVLQSNFGASILQAYNRVNGTIFGLLFGLMLFIFFHKSIIFLFIAFPILIFIFSYTATTSQITAIFTASMLIGIIFSYAYPDTPWNFVFWRIIDTIIGSLIALICLYLLFPKLAKDELKTSLIESLEKSQKLFNESCNNLWSPITSEIKNNQIKQIVAIERLLAKKRQQLSNYVYEPKIKSQTKNIMYDIILSQERIHSIILSVFTTFNQSDLLISQDLQNSIKELTQKLTLAVEDLSNALLKQSTLPSLELLIAEIRKNKSSFFVNDEAHPALFLMYRNFLVYTNELRHIVLGIEQLRNMQEVPL